MRRVLRWLVGLPIAIVVIAFAIANRRWVTLSFDPFSIEAPSRAIDLPLWLLVFFGVLIGLLVGWTAAWFSQGKWRKAARDARAETARLQTELADLRKPRDENLMQQDVVPFNGGYL